MVRSFLDGVRSFTSSLINRRSTEMTSYVDTVRLSDADLRAIYKTGLGNKIIRIKAGDALKDTLKFETTEDEKFYKARLDHKVKEAARWCLAFGRGLIVLHRRGEDLSKPLSRVDDPERMLLSVFDGGMVTVGDIVTDLQDPRYLEPLAYTARGVTIHHSRAIDFTYLKPPEVERPNYRYGGISEFELIYEQILADGVVQRASPRLIDKASTLFYKVAGFKDAMRTKQEEEMVTYFQRLEDVRGIMAAGLIDAEDEVEAISQTIANLADADQITLRRLAMVTGISVTRLIGEAPRGMNSTGEKEAQMDLDMLETLQADYFHQPINELMRKLGQGTVEFKDNQGDTPNSRMDYETKAIDNALKLADLGLDYGKYLEDKNVVKPEDFDTVFKKEAPIAPASEIPAPEGPAAPASEPAAPEDPHAVDPTAALNGAQVTAMLEIVGRVQANSLDKPTAIRLMAASFPLSRGEAAELLADVVVSPVPVEGIEPDA